VKNNNNNIPGWEGLGCKSCNSPFHSEGNCPQTAAKESKFKFRSSHELGLAKGELPYKFRVEINPEADNEVEITRKRALLRLNSDRTYKQMAFSTQAADHQKIVLGWLLQLGDNMDEDEKKSLIPIIGSVQKALEDLQVLKTEKINQAVKMEEVVERGRKTARKARIRIAERTSKEKRHQLGEFWVLRLPDTSVDIPIPVGSEDLLELFEGATEEIKRAERRKTIEDE
jgi:hypothetical protein